MLKKRVQRDNTGKPGAGDVLGSDSGALLLKDFAWPLAGSSRDVSLTDEFAAIAEESWKFCAD